MFEYELFFILYFAADAFSRPSLSIQLYFTSLFNSLDFCLGIFCSKLHLYKGATKKSHNGSIFRSFTPISPSSVKPNRAVRCAELQNKVSSNFHMFKYETECTTGQNWMLFEKNAEQHLALSGMLALVRITASAENYEDRISRGFMLDCSRLHIRPDFSALLKILWRKLFPW